MMIPDFRGDSNSGKNSSFKLCLVIVTGFFQMIYDLYL